MDRIDTDIRLKNGRFENLPFLLQTNFNGNFSDSKRCLNRIIQGAIRVVDQKPQAFSNDSRSLPPIGVFGRLKNQHEHLIGRVG
jgi:hypothetical protein